MNSQNMEVLYQPQMKNTPSPLHTNAIHFKYHSLQCYNIQNQTISKNQNKQRAITPNAINTSAVTPSLKPHKCYNSQ